MGRDNLPEDRAAAGRAGGIASGASRRAKREELQRAAEDRLAESLDRAAKALEDALEAELVLVDKEGEEHRAPNHRARVAAADKVFDRVVGKPSVRHEHSGRVELDITTVRAKLDDLLSKRSSD